MYPVIFTPIAREELIEAQDWYEREARGLGRRFLTALNATVERMSANPRQFPVVHKSVRRALLRHFPYARMFVIEPDETQTVLACFHGSCDPQKRQRRM